MIVITRVTRYWLGKLGELLVRHFHTETPPGVCNVWLVQWWSPCYDTGPQSEPALKRSWVESESETPECTYYCTDIALSSSLCMYIYIYICKYICTYVCIVLAECSLIIGTGYRVQVLARSSIAQSVCERAFSIYIYIYIISVYVCMYSCMYVCMYVCIYVCVCVCVGGGGGGGGNRPSYAIVIVMVV